MSVDPKISSLLISTSIRFYWFENNGRNLVKAINTWAVVAVRCTVGIVDWAVELKATDRKTSKPMIMNGALHPQAGRTSLDVSGGSGMIGGTQSVKLLEKSRGAFRV